MYHHSDNSDCIPLITKKPKHCLSEKFNIRDVQRLPVHDAVGQAQTPGLTQTPINCDFIDSCRNNRIFTAI